MAELTARERRLVHMTSNIFDEKGSDKSVYSASRQKELLENLRQSYVQKNGAPEAMNLPRPQEMKYALMSGNHAVLPASSAVNGPGTKRDAQFMPKEFWSTSVDLKWHDVRNERCRHKSHAAERANLDAKDKKTREMSSELFQKERLVNRTMGKSDLVADGTDYLALDSSLHEQHGTVPGGATGRRSSASQRQQANLAASGYNTMPQPEVAPEVTGGYAQEHPARRSGKEMRNYSDLFGSEMGRRPAPTQQRQDIIGTSTCTFLDHRGEIEAARREEGRLAGATTPANRKEAEMSSTLHGHKTPRGQKAPELEQALAVERGVWDSKEGMAINAEVSRRHREKEFNKDFEGDVFHLSRKQDCLDSSQVRENIGQPAPIEAPVSPRSGAGLMSPYSPTRQGGPSAAKREKMLQFAKDLSLSTCSTTQQGHKACLTAVKHFLLSDGNAREASLARNHATSLAGRLSLRHSRETLRARLLPCCWLSAGNCKSGTMVRDHAKGQFPFSRSVPTTMRIRFQCLELAWGSKKCPSQSAGRHLCTPYFLVW